MINVVLHDILNAGPNQVDLANRAAALLQRVVNDQMFASELQHIQFSYIQRVDDDNRPEDILTAIINGQEYRTQPDGTIDLTVRLQNFKYKGIIPNHKTIGATPVGGPVILTSYFFMNIWVANDDVVSVAGHFMHEWMHVAGYSHLTSAGDQYDVPYAVGYLVEHIAHELLRADSGAGIIPAGPQ